MDGPIVNSLPKSLSSSSSLLKVALDPPPTCPRLDSVVEAALEESSAGAVIGPPKATVYRFLGVGLTLVCLCVAGLGGGGRPFPFPEGVGLIACAEALAETGAAAEAVGFDEDNSDGDIVRPPNEEETEE
jgi:hypothetical protein